MKALGAAIAAGPLLGLLGLSVVAGASGTAAARAGGSAQVTVRVANTSTGSCVLTDGSGRFTARLTPGQVANAATVDAVGRQLGVSADGEVIALATALQESELVNVQYGDRDSLGLFQQRPSQGWGTPSQVSDPTYAAAQFYMRLQRVPGWQDLPLTVAAQAVQRSAFPDAYARWQPEAIALDAALLHQSSAVLTC